MSAGGLDDEHVCFPLAQEPVDLPVPRLAGHLLTCRSDRQLVDVVKVSAVLIDVNPGLVDTNPVLTGAINSAHNKKSVADSKCQNNVVGGPTSTPLKIAGLTVDIAGDVAVGVSSPADLAGDVTIGVSFLADLVGYVIVGVASPADLAGDVTVGVASRPTLLGVVTIGVASSAEPASVVTAGRHRRCGVG